MTTLATLLNDPDALFAVGLAAIVTIVGVGKLIDRFCFRDKLSHAAPAEDHHG